MSGQQSTANDPQRLAQEVEDLEYLNDVMAARLANIETANEERIPGWVVDRCMAGEAPALVWRELRKLTLSEVAAAAGLPESVLAGIESGSAEAGLRQMGKLALALRIDLDDLIPWNGDGEAAS